MDKKKLQTDIHEARYQPELWLEVLKLYFGNTFLSFKKTLNPILDGFKSYRNHPENPLLAEYSWFSFYKTLNSFQKNILEKLYPVQAWEPAFYSVYFPLLLHHFSEEKLNFNESNYTEIRTKIFLSQTFTIKGAARIISDGL